MIYLIVANQIMEVLTDMDEALEQARHYAPKVGDITVADMATGWKPKPYDRRNEWRNPDRRSCSLKHKKTKHTD